MKIIITIECNNAAFGPDEGQQGIEVARILQRYAAHLRETYHLTAERLRDSDGNTVGWVETKD